MGLLELDVLVLVAVILLEDLEEPLVFDLELHLLLRGAVPVTDHTYYAPQLHPVGKEV